MTKQLLSWDHENLREGLRVFSGLCTASNCNCQSFSLKGCLREFVWLLHWNHHPRMDCHIHTGNDNVSLGISAILAWIQYSTAYYYTFIHGLHHCHCIAALQQRRCSVFTWLCSHVSDQPKGPKLTKYRGIRLHFEGQTPWSPCQSPSHKISVSLIYPDLQPTVQYLRVGISYFDGLTK